MQSSSSYRGSLLSTCFRFCAMGGGWVLTVAFVSQFKIVITEVLLADFFLALLADRILQFLLGRAKLKVPS